MALVHHSKKGASRKRPGQALRGSSDLHAWGDSNLYLARPEEGSEIQLTVEHRAAPSCEPLSLELVSEGDLAYLQIARPAEPPRSQPVPAATSEERIVEALAVSSAPLRISTLRDLVGLRHQTVSDTIANLIHRGVVRSTDGGYLLAVRPSD